MSTVLYPTPIYGPVNSRRLGISLGVNLMPKDGKMCTFDCIYCECGYNSTHRTDAKRPTRTEVAEALGRKLIEMHADGTPPDVITFAGNGEPTGHPQFLGVIQDTISLRNKYCPNAKISVLSNSTLCGRKEVHDALMLVDNNILKLDTVNDDYIRLVDRPVSSIYRASEVVENMKSFNGHVIVQTMFMTGHNDDGVSVDNTGDEYVNPWLEALQQIKPSEVMIYTIARETPDGSIQKASHAILDDIRQRVINIGIPCTASY